MKAQDKNACRLHPGDLVRSIVAKSRSRVGFSIGVYRDLNRMSDPVTRVSPLDVVLVVSDPHDSAEEHWTNNVWPVLVLANNALGWTWTDWLERVPE